MSDEMSGMERELRLVQASADYMAGRITMDELHEAERLYGVDNGAAARTLAEHYREQSLVYRYLLPMVRRAHRIARGE